MLTDSCLCGGTALTQLCYCILSSPPDNLQETVYHRFKDQKSECLSFFALQFRIMTANAIFGVIQYWLSASPRTSPEETARIICRLHFR